jgi:hypothetical protein
MNSTLQTVICPPTEIMVYEAHATFAMVATILALVISLYCCGASARVAMSATA